MYLDDVENTVMNDQLSLSQVLKKLKKEVKLLDDKKQKIIDSHRNLLFILNKRVEAKKNNNEKLRLEIENQKKACLRMANVLNASIRLDFDDSLLH